MVKRAAAGRERTIVWLMSTLQVERGDAERRYNQAPPVKRAQWREESAR